MKREGEREKRHDKEGGVRRREGERDVGKEGHEIAREGEA